MITSYRYRSRKKKSGDKQQSYDYTNKFIKRKKISRLMNGPLDAHT